MGGLELVFAETRLLRDRPEGSGRYVAKDGGNRSCGTRDETIDIGERAPVLQNFVDDRPRNDLERAEVKVAGLADQSRRHDIVEPAAEIAEHAVFLDPVLGVDHVVALLGFGQEPLDLFGRVLEIVVNDGRIVAGAVRQGAHHGVVLPEVPPQRDGGDLRESRRQLVADLFACVSASIVDQDDFQLMTFTDAGDALDQKPYRPCSVVDGNANGQLHDFPSASTRRISFTDTRRHPPQ